VQRLKVVIRLEMLDVLIALGDRLPQQLDGPGGLLLGEPRCVSTRSFGVAFDGGGGEGEDAGENAERGGRHVICLR
jgi:hypothetical protein